MSVFNAVTQDIVGGGNLLTLLGLSVYSKEVRDAGKKLSPIYKKSLMIENATGDVPKNLYQTLNTTLQEFISALKTYTFSEESNNIQFADKNLNP
jgi:hypothetical protein